MNLNLRGSVGKGGVNHPEDVAAVKARLIALGFNWLSAGSLLTTEVVRTIKLFQSIKSGRQTVDGDGRIDVGQDTHRWLEAENAPHWKKMPIGDKALGFFNVEVAQEHNDNHDFGTDWLADMIAAAGAEYHDRFMATHPNAGPIVVNDASIPTGGDSTDHKGHETGLCCDLRLARKDGSTAGGIVVHSSIYDRDAMRAILQALRHQSLVSKIFLNDSVLINEGLCTRQSGHDNHVHVEIGVPVRKRDIN